MPLSVCPTATAQVPADRVWAILADPNSYGEWTDARAITVEPPGPATPGQVIHLRAGPLGIGRGTLRVLEADATARVLQLDSRFSPLAVTVRTRIQVVPLDAHSCRTTFG